MFLWTTETKRPEIEIKNLWQTSRKKDRIMKIHGKRENEWEAFTFCLFVSQAIFPPLPSLPYSTCPPATWLSHSPANLSPFPSSTLSVLMYTSPFYPVSASQPLENVSLSHFCWSVVSVLHEIPELLLSSVVICIWVHSLLSITHHSDRSRGCNLFFAQ